MRPSTAAQHLMTGRMLSAYGDAPIGPMVWTLSPDRRVAQDKELRCVSVLAPGWPLAPSGLP
jgi:hypothetical protein